MLRAVSSEDKKSHRPDTAAVTKATRTKGTPRTKSRDLPPSVSDWKVSDVQSWLKMNNLTYLQNKYEYDTT